MLAQCDHLAETYFDGFEQDLGKCELRYALSFDHDLDVFAASIGLMKTSVTESGVKIELMEWRMEVVKKQADTIADLEIELSKAHKQERAYEEAMEQLQADLDMFEQDNAKLKALAAASERQAAGAQLINSENVPISRLFVALSVSCTQKTQYLKGPVSRVHTPPLDPSGQPDTDESDSKTPPAPPTIHSLVFVRPTNPSTTRIHKLAMSLDGMNMHACVG
ncbi:uncharacterized protein EDB91DRAFT_1281278 [Suillus paluster]|uniref:uncharacterized protein n=1 Tax=Suillus paluster TaxID=48578 RepID=UPI001B87CB63|nr:uncharacterized protein EDB91DRAFT_1281278 [Suillus paluster]KAG1720540.1 hypothetical protein EDB91DRAFT_1281278 [Suillus paluster]